MYLSLSEASTVTECLHTWEYIRRQLHIDRLREKERNSYQNWFENNLFETFKRGMTYLWELFPLSLSVYNAYNM